MASLSQTILLVLESSGVSVPAPVISGNVLLAGSTLTSTPAASYQWQRNGSNISGATNQTYIWGVADLGAAITCVTPGGTSNTLTMAAAIRSVAFATVDAAPLTNPYAGEVNYLRAVDANSTVSADGTQLIVNGTPAASDLVVSGTSGGAASSDARTDGRIFTLSIPDTRVSVGASTRFGWAISGSDTTVSVGASASTTVLAARDGSTLMRSTTLGAGIWKLLFIMDAVGGRLVSKVDSGTPRLEYVFPNGTAALFEKLALSAAAHNMAFKNWISFDSNLLNKADALLNKTPVNGQQETATADGEIILKGIVLPSASVGLANVVLVRMDYHIQDASNFNSYFLQVNAAGDAIDLRNTKTIAGTETTVSGGFPILGVGSLLTMLHMRTEGAAQDRWTGTGTAPDTVRSSTFTSSNFNTATGLKISWDASVTMTGAKLEFYPTTNPLYTPFF